MAAANDLVISTGQTTKMYVGYGRFDEPYMQWMSLDNLSKNHDFIDLLFVKLVGRRPRFRERELLLRTLLYVSMGVGDEPPSVFAPKTVASTTKDARFAVINGLIAGLATFGTHHLGAVYDVMQMYQQLRGQNVPQYVSGMLSRNELICGFGHPHYAKDPRPQALLSHIQKHYGGNEYLQIYLELSNELLTIKQIHPNIDAIAGLSYCCLGFEPMHGIYLSFLARSLSMICHISEELPKKPFSGYLQKTITNHNSPNHDSQKITKTLEH